MELGKNQASFAVYPVSQGREHRNKAVIINSRLGPAGQTFLTYAEIFRNNKAKPPLCPLSIIVQGLFAKLVFRRGIMAVHGRHYKPILNLQLSNF